MTDTYEISGSERDWLGPKDEKKYLTFEGQSTSTQSKWFFSEDLIELDPYYSEFSVRLHDPRCRSLSFIHRTLAILPKSKLRIIYRLIGDYLAKIDETKSST